VKALLSTPNFQLLSKYGGSPKDIRFTFRKRKLRFLVLNLSMMS